jgi:hypothetical protein
MGLRTSLESTRTTTLISQKAKRIYFHGMFDMPCGLLLQAPVLWFSGLPGPPDDSLRVPRDGGLLTPVDPPVGGSFDVADEGSMWFADFDTLRLPAMKLLTTTCNEIDGSISLAGRLTNAE